MYPSKSQISTGSRMPFAAGRHPRCFARLRYKCFTANSNPLATQGRKRKLAQRLEKGGKSMVLERIKRLGRQPSLTVYGDVATLLPWLKKSTWASADGFHVQMA